jgi:hypothetical protein
MLVCLYVQCEREVKMKHGGKKREKKKKKIKEGRGEERKR